jgi:replicative DNA helicase
MMNGHSSSEILLAPFNQEAEEAVIGSVLTSAHYVFGDLRAYLRPSHFYLTRHRILWEAFETVSDRGEIIDMTSIASELGEMGTNSKLDEIGGYAYLIHLIGVPSNSMNADTYGRAVHRAALRRGLLEAADAARQAATDDTIEADVAVYRSMRAFDELQHEAASVKANIRSLPQATRAKFEALMEAKKRHQENPHYVVGVRTGITDLDRLLDGLRAGSVSTLAGATGSGKTALTLQIALFASEKGFLRAGESQAAVHVFSGEMTEDKLMDRMLSAKTGIPVRTIERGSFNSAQEQALIDAMHDLDMNHRLTFEGASRMNVAQIRQRVRSLSASNDLDLLILDGLLQIEGIKIDDRDSKKRQNYVKQQRRDLIEEIMNELENTAISYDRAILQTHQLSRASKDRANKRPLLTDLAEANFVEQKSAVIMLLYREGYYDKLCENPNAAEIIVEKNRFGNTDTIHMHYDAQYTRFVDADKVPYSFGR